MIQIILCVLRMPDFYPINRTRNSAIMGKIVIKPIRRFIPSAVIAFLVISSTLQAQDETAYTPEEVQTGKALFDGSRSLLNGGPSCLSCHHVSQSGLAPGGLLAKDLTNAYSRMGEAGLAGILGSPPFPAMVTAYQGKPLTEGEIRALSAFFESADSPDAQPTESMGSLWLALGGGGGLVILLILVSRIWAERKKESVKASIFRRQVRSI